MAKVDLREGLGVTTRELVEGAVVMVPVGRLVAHVNGDPCMVAWAVVLSPVDEDPDLKDPMTRWWLNVYAVPGGEPLPQMYPIGEILGVPALGLSMNGAPPRA